MKNIEIIAKESGREFWINNTSNKGWYTCILTGKKFRNKEEVTIMLEEQKTHLMNLEEEKEKLPEIFTPTPAVTVTIEVNGKEINAVRTAKLDVRLEIEENAKTTIIHCLDCNTPREIKVQDAFQVKRCPECQKAHRNAMRRLRRKEKQAQNSK